MDLTIFRNHQLQNAIRRNSVSFPSQAPVFRGQARADIQWRLAVLYFVRGWSLTNVAKRYRMSRERAGQIIKAWRVLSIESGYIQAIPPAPARERETALLTLKCPEARVMAMSPDAPSAGSVDRRSN